MATRKRIKKATTDRKRNTTIIKAKKIGRIIIRKKPSVANPYLYQVQFQQPGQPAQFAGAYYTSSRIDALKQAEMDLKRRKLWQPNTKLITSAVPLNSTAARHKNAVIKTHAQAVEVLREFLQDNRITENQLVKMQISAYNNLPVNLSSTQKTARADIEVANNLLASKKYFPTTANHKNAKKTQLPKGTAARHKKPRSQVIIKRHENPIPVSAVPSGYVRALGKKQVSALLRSKDPLSLADKKRMESYKNQDFKKYDTWIQFSNWLYARENAIKNPLSNSVRKIRETFTGLKSRKTTVMNAPQGTPANLAKLGKLISIKAAKATLKPARRNPGSIVWLCADSQGKLHLCTTGDRLIDGPAQSFGEIREIEYEAIKPHLGHKRPTIFFHTMAEEGGKRPELRADGAGGLKIQGGTYFITPEGIRD